MREALFFYSIKSLVVQTNADCAAWEPPPQLDQSAAEVLDCWWQFGGRRGGSFYLRLMLMLGQGQTADKNTNPAQQV